MVLNRQGKEIMKRRFCDGGRSALASLALSCGTAAALATTTAEQNWPQWRGPLQSGAAPAADPPTNWSETNNIKWKVKIPGEGSSTPLVWDNLIFVQTAVPTGKKVEPKPTAKAQDSLAGRPDVGSPPPLRGPEPGAGGGSMSEGMGGGMGPGPGAILSERMISDGDKDKDSKLTRDEFT